MHDLFPSIRRFEVFTYEKGNGSKSTSPDLYIVPYLIVRIIPDLLHARSLRVHDYGISISHDTNKYDVLLAAIFVIAVQSNVIWRVTSYITDSTFG